MDAPVSFSSLHQTWERPAPKTEWAVLALQEIWEIALTKVEPLLDFSETIFQTII
jgi:hypothetical protein